MAKKKPIKHIGKSHQVKTGIKPLYQAIAVIAVLALVIFLVFPDLLKKNNADDEYHFKKEGELTFYSTDNEQNLMIDIEIVYNGFD